MWFLSPFEVIVFVIKNVRELCFEIKISLLKTNSLFSCKVSGLILLLAFSCSGYLLYAESSFSSVPPSLQTLLCHYRWPRVTKSPLNSKWGLTHWAVLFLTTTAVWAAMVHISLLDYCIINNTCNRLTTALLKA